MSENVKKDMSHYSVTLTIRHKSCNSTEEITEQRLSEMMGSDVRIVNVKVSHERDGGVEYLTAAPCGDAEYPGIALDGVLPGKGEEAESYYLAQAELPNNHCQFMTSRLYAGNANLESDAPVALMAHGRRDEEDESRRVVYLDHDIATTHDMDSSELNFSDNANAMLSELSSAVTYRYVVVMDSSYLRDTQSCDNLNKMDDDNSWSDFSASAYLGIYEAHDALEAVNEAARDYCVPTGALNAIQV